MRGGIVSRREALGMGLSSLAGSFAWAGNTKRGRISLNLGTPTFHNGYSPFVNWWKLGSSYELNCGPGGKISGKAAWDAGRYFDRDTGDLARPLPREVITATRLFYSPPGRGAAIAGYNFSGVEWAIKWEGQARCSIKLLTEGGSQAMDNRRGFGTFILGRDPGDTYVEFTIVDHEDPPRNVLLYQARYAAQVVAGDVFNPDWIKEIRRFGVLRLMEFQTTNNAGMSDWSQLANEDYYAWAGPTAEPGVNSSRGLKGGTPLSVICELANVTGCDVHLCIPHLATNDFVRRFAEYFRDRLIKNQVVIFEYSNECWNFIFKQTRHCFESGERMWPGDPARHWKWYGYRSAECMDIVRQVYGTERNRWKGCLATQTVNPAVTINGLTGIRKFLGNGSVTQVSSLFDWLAVTGYFGDVQTCKKPSDIGNGRPALVFSHNHGYRNGDRVKYFVNSGMRELNEVVAVVSNATPDTYEILDTDTSSFGKWRNDNQNYTVHAALFDLMRDSGLAHRLDPLEHPTKYDLYNRVVAKSWRSGSGVWSGGTFKTVVSVDELVRSYWPKQKIIADANGLALVQYEGGCHFVGDAYLSGFGGNPQFTEFLIATGHTKETADVYQAMYDGFRAVGGSYPSKFVEGGRTSQYGTWAGMRYIPGDDLNPVWVATREFNDH